MRFRPIAIPSTILLASLLTVQLAHGECVRIPVQQVADRQDVGVIFTGSAVSTVWIGDPQKVTGVKVTFDVDRIWKGSAGKRFELYMDNNANNPQFELGHASVVFAKYLDRDMRQRFGIGQTDAPAFSGVPCTDFYSVSEISALLGSGVAPRQVSAEDPQVLDSTAEYDAYAVYATLLQPLRDMKGPVLLQRETEGPTKCSEFLAGMAGEWVEVASNFRRENIRVRLLQAGFPMGVEYRLVPRAEILADDARLAAKYPGTSNAPRPGSLQYIAVSAVGFNAARTKALVYVRSRMSNFSDAVVMKELKEGKWVTGASSCGGVA